MSVTQLTCASLVSQQKCLRRENPGVNHRPGEYTSPKTLHSCGEQEQRSGGRTKRERGQRESLEHHSCELRRPIQPCTDRPLSNEVLQR
ncbi:hypothetical protein NQZ68_012008 [Dissostichus eleginoides]|nr:hypothetical protein NQZ68_012008 [Dissostichus eleginoides]